MSHTFVFESKFKNFASNCEDLICCQNSNRFWCVLNWCEQYFDSVWTRFWFDVNKILIWCEQDFDSVWTRFCIDVNKISKWWMMDDRAAVVEFGLQPRSFTPRRRIVIIRRPQKLTFSSATPTNVLCDLFITFLWTLLQSKQCYILLWQQIIRRPQKLTFSSATACFARNEQAFSVTCSKITFLWTLLRWYILLWRQISHWQKLTLYPLLCLFFQIQIKPFLWRDQKGRLSCSKWSELHILEILQDKGFFLQKRQI